MKKTILMTVFFTLLSSGAVADSGYLTGVGGGGGGAPEFAGITTLAYDGDDMGSLAAADAQCVTDTGEADAYVCTDNDVSLMLADGEVFGGATDEVWVHDGTPGFTANANNCAVWTNTGVTYFSGYWNLSVPRPNLSGCGSSKKYLCCK